MTYNTDIKIWDTPAARKSYPRLTVSDEGDVSIPTGYIVARFLSACKAKNVLRLAGWHFSGPHGWIDSAATLASADMPAQPEADPAGPDWAVLGPRLAEAAKAILEDENLSRNDWPDETVAALKALRECLPEKCKRCEGVGAVRREGRPPDYVTCPSCAGRKIKDAKSA